MCDNGAIFSMHHDDGFLNLDPSDFIGEYGKWIEAKPFQILIPLRVHDPWILVRRELGALTVKDQCVFEFG